MKIWPDNIVEFMIRNGNGNNNPDLTNLINAEFNTSYSVYQVKRKRCLVGANSNIDARFKKGHVSFNKGRKGYYAPGSEKGWFKKGNIPHNYIPVGTEVLRIDGYLWRKVSDTIKPSRKNWKQVHRIIYEEFHGPIPKGHSVIFIDQNPTNLDINNLALLKRKELLVLNQNYQLDKTTEININLISLAKIKSRVYEIQKAG